MRCGHTSRTRAVVWYLDVYVCRLWRESLGFLLLWACLDSAHSRSCSSFFCRKSHLVSALNGVDPGSPLFLTPYLEKGAIDEGIIHAHYRILPLCCSSRNSSIMTTWNTIQPPFVPARRLSLVGDLPGANVKSYAGYLTVNRKYNSNLFFWFFPALMVGPHFFFTAWTSQNYMLRSGSGSQGGDRY